MNARGKKKVDKRRRKAIHKILDVVIDVNGLHESNCEVTGDHPTAFFEFSGHVGVVYALFDKHGWSKGRKRDIWLSAHVDDPGELNRLIDKVEDINKYGLSN